MTETMQFIRNLFGSETEIQISGECEKCGATVVVNIDLVKKHYCSNYYVVGNGNLKVVNGNVRLRCLRCKSDTVEFASNYGYIDLKEKWNKGKMGKDKDRGKYEVDVFGKIKNQEEKGKEEKGKEEKGKEEKGKNK